MNQLRRILRPLVCTLLGVYLLLLFVLNFSPTQRLMTKAAADLLSDLFKTEVHIGSIEVGLFNRLILKDVLLKDNHGEPLMEIDLLTAKIELRSLLSEQISLRTISVLDASFHLYKKDEKSAPNYQFLIDTFSSDKTSKPINLRINSLILRRVSLSYDRLDKKCTPGHWNADHIALNDVDANISLKHITPDSLSLRMRHFSFKEHSGFELKRLSFKLVANRTRARLNDFECSLPASRIKENEVIAHYDARRDWKNIWPTLQVEGNIDETNVTLADLTPFLHLPSPELAHIGIELHTDYAISRRFIRLGNLHLNNHEGNLSLQANIHLQRDGGRVNSLAVNLKDLYARPEFNAFLIRNLAPQTDTTVIKIVHRLGNVHLAGEGNYAFDTKKGEAKVHALTEAGKIACTANVHHRHVSGKVLASTVNPAYLLANPKLPTLVTLTAEGDLEIPKEKGLTDFACTSTVSHLTYLGRDLRDIHLSASRQKNKLTAKVTSRNDIADLDVSLSALLDGKRIEQFQAAANVARLVPSALGLQTQFGDVSLQGDLTSDIYINRNNNPRGSLSLREFRMKGGPRGDAFIDRLETRLEDHPSGGQLKLTSDFADILLKGSLNPGDLAAAGKAIVRRSLPGLLIEDGKATEASQKLWQVNASLRPSTIYHRLFGINLTLGGPLSLQGTLDGGTGRTVLTGSVDSLSAGGQHFGESSLFVEGKDSTYHVLVKTQKEVSGHPFRIAADLSTIRGNLLSRISWNAAAENNYDGSLAFNTRFVSHKAGNPPSFNVELLPTNFSLADSVWQISSGHLSYIDNVLTFDRVRLSHADQALAIQGRFSPDRRDSVVAELKAIDIDYILSLVDFHAVDFGGRATGHAVMTMEEAKPVLSVNINVPDFTFNQGPMGNADIVGGWTARDNRILLDADMKLATKNAPARTRVKGFVDLKEKGLHLDIHADKTNLRFLRRYMAGIFTDFEGNATGDITIYGPFKKLNFDGRAKANAEARIDAIGVKYRVNNGTVDLSPGTFAFSDFTITDGLGGKGVANGTLRHHFLSNLTYDFNIRADRLLCYDNPATHDLPFSSHTVGTGLVKLHGLPGKMTADISLRPEQGTTLAYTLGTAGTFSNDEGMFRFHQAMEDNNTRGERVNTSEVKNEEAENSGTTDIKLYFLIDMNPLAEVKIITDPRAGDNITAYGEGPIRAFFHNKGNFEMYGTYRLKRGTFKLSLQDIIRKDFTLKEGSSLTFAGNPLQADLDLRAAYTVNGVSLSDLNYTAEFSQKSARVDCLLNIGGKAASPKINFDLDLHNISTDEKEMVRRLIATEEDLNRQAIYLLGVGRFYTAEAQSGVNQSNTRDQSAAAMRSFLSTTLTGQLNTAISSAIGSGSNWSFGTNVAPGTLGWSDIEVDGLLQGRLFNDRLLINGNFGYRDRPTYTSNFVGDFDIRYLLTPRGTVSLKAYSETTDRYFTKSALTTQGVGITLQRDFSSLRDLFRPTTKRKEEKKTKKKAH